MKKLVVFDICGTLYRSNTTYDFLLFYFRRSNPKKYRKFKIYLSLPAKLLWKILTILGFRKKIRSFLIGQLKDEEVAKVEEQAVIFIEQYLASRKLELTQKELARYQKDEYSKVVLASASIEPVVKAIAGKQGVICFFSTSLEKVGNKYTGRIQFDMEGNKLDKVLDLKRTFHSEKMVFYTDNKEDLALAEEAEEVIIIAKKKNTHFWTEKLRKHANFKLINI